MGDAVLRRFFLALSCLHASFLVFIVVNVLGYDTVQYCMWISMDTLVHLQLQLGDLQSEGPGEGNMSQT
jgi:hypothetical protein